MNCKALFVAAVMVCTGSIADAARNGVVVGQTQLPTVHVKSSDGNNYTHVVLPTYSLALQISGQCPDNYGVHAATARALSWPGSEGSAYTDDLRERDRRLSARLVRVPEALTAIEWHGTWKQRVVAACNTLMSQKLSAGKTRQQVLASNWSLNEVEVDQVEGVLICNKIKGTGGGFDSTGGQQFDMQNSARVKVICDAHRIDNVTTEKKPIAINDTITTGTHVVQSYLTVLPKHTGGACGITLSGLIETNVINATVTLFYRNNKGGSTPWRTVHTDHSKTAFFSDYLDFRTNSGASLNENTPTTPSAGGNAQNTFAPTPSNNDHTGYYQIIGKNIAFESNLAEFSFNCGGAMPNKVTAPQGAQPNRALKTQSSPGSAPDLSPASTTKAVTAPKSKQTPVKKAVGATPIQPTPAAGSNQIAQPPPPPQQLLLPAIQKVREAARSVDEPSTPALK